MSSNTYTCKLSPQEQGEHRAIHRKYAEWEEAMQTCLRQCSEGLPTVQMHLVLCVDVFKNANGSMWGLAFLIELPKPP